MQILDLEFVYQLHSEQFLDDDSVVLAIRKFQKSYVEVFSSCYFRRKILTAKELFRIVPLHNGDAFANKVFQRADIARIITDYNAAAHRDVWEGKIKLRFSFGGATNQRKNLDLSIYELLFDINPGADLETDFFAHRFKGSSQELY